MRAKFVVCAIGALLLTGSGASGHEASKGPHGGALIDVAGHHVEFIPSSSELTFYLTDESDAPIASSGSALKAIVQDGGKTIQVKLDPAAPNKLIGKIAAPLSAGAKVVISGSLADGHALQGRFVVP